jgi:hypothetical protein
MPPGIIPMDVFLPDHHNMIYVIEINEFHILFKENYLYIITEEAGI